MTAAQIVERYMPLITRVALRIARQLPASVDRRDVINEGVVGVLRALRSWDGREGVRFSTFISYRIAGQILDYLRGCDWRTRYARDGAKRIEAAREILAQEFGREPSSDELCRYLGVPSRTFKVWLGAERSIPISLDQPVETRLGMVKIDLPDCETVEESVLHAEVCAEIRAAIARLSSQEQMVVQGVFFQGASAETLGSKMGVSSSRVSQIKSQAVRKMSEILGAA